MAGDFIKYTQRFGTLTFFFLIFTLILSMGITMNFMVIQANEGKMPVSDKYLHQETSDGKLEKHMVYNDKEEINYYYLSDIIPFFDKFILSIGDIFILFSWVGILTSTIFCFVYNIKKSRGRKR